MSGHIAGPAGNFRFSPDQPIARPAHLIRMNTIINALLPVFVTLLLGYFAAWHHDVDGRAASILNKMVMSYSLPLSLFAGTVTMSRDQLVSNLPLVLALFVGVVIPFAVMVVAAKYVFRRGLGESTLQALAISFPAVPFIGLPVLGAIIGAQGATLTVAVAGLITNVAIVPAAIILLSAATAGNQDPTKEAGQNPGISAGAASRPSIGSIVLSSLEEPVVWAPILAIALVFIGLKIPEPLVKSFQLLGSATSGVSLFASGVILRSQKPTVSRPIVISTLCRLVVVPSLALLLLPLLKLNAAAMRESVLALAMPCAVILVILSVRYKTAEQESASVMLYSYVFSALTLAAAIVITR